VSETLNQPGDLVEALCRRIEAWIRHGEAVPADVASYSREIVHHELREMIAEARAGARASRLVDLADTIADAKGITFTEAADMLQEALDTPLTPLQATGP
jgi:hypothetical protein